MEPELSESGPSNQQPPRSSREHRNLRAPTREEENAIPLPELVLPQIEGARLAEEAGRGLRDEEQWRREQEQGAGLSEVAAPVPVERTPSRIGPWDSLESAVSRVSARSPAPAGGESAEYPTSEFATKLYIISYLVFFSIFGALARIGLEALTFYAGAPVTTGVLWANVGGCLLMGFFVEDRNLFREEWGKQRIPEKQNVQGAAVSSQVGPEEASPEEDRKMHKAIKKTIPLYVGLTTGFCGSFTSFSSFMADTFLALSNDLPNPNTSSILPRNGGYSFMAVVAIILYTVSLSLSSLAFGAHLALVLDRFTPTLPFLVTRRILDRAMVLLGFGCWLAAIFLALWPPDRHRGIHENWRGRAVFATVFAPLGCLLRYYVSLFLNARIPSLPLGTFAVNIFGTMVLGMCYDLKHAIRLLAIPTPDSPFGVGRLTSCQVLNGVVDGFCGCTTTVSTWVVELYTLELRHAYRYGILTIALALSLLVVIMGSMRWTVGFGIPVCLNYR
ncbi:hypothetical protein LOZ12_002829 [Ophidiomyces ophidiicola]|uniref:Uncharacterized protein n=1 Tax=Ophidiomyces ophidiicola TaxID=1387563 RepID=A0ACB8UZS4_9EURO|nr:hypothetical protein LOZ64_000489 [Ophidiomyces ophidiicola]KAI1948570.1 hypothetical protein LOZ62_002647 [Ophidiomyces ophidiicola]KAI1958351.1 hypothetical protein LOZ59_003548 [Ophidiomyces ophidiicola]KAI1969295.1 hypothetical protein LOZ56_004516 [Ophidiomyces ophidiicola]KAI2034771.1 hypothetical protein LOZ47_004939 [Ophidiomyces ophidiicola]